MLALHRRGERFFQGFQALETILQVAISVTVKRHIAVRAEASIAKLLDGLRATMPRFNERFRGLARDCNLQFSWRDMATTFCLINQKGGCGKSSTCFHLAGAFAELGMNVLLLDMDPQGSLSQGFLGSEFVEALSSKNTMAMLFDENSHFESREKLLHSTQFDTITICPANQTLAPFNIPEPEKDGMVQYAVRDFLAEQTDFDVVLIDCPPNLYRCSWASMIAADYVLIPVPPEDFGTQGLRAVHQCVQQARRLNPNLRRLGHLITRCDRRLLVHRMYEQKLRELYGDLVMDTVVTEASAFKVALTRRRPVQFHDARSKAAKLTLSLAHEILDRISLDERKCRVA